MTCMRFENHSLGILYPQHNHEDKVSDHGCEINRVEPNHHKKTVKGTGLDNQSVETEQDDLKYLHNDPGLDEQLDELEVA